MARGGSRPGAGRPKRAADIPPDITRAAVNADMTPLDYMLTVMRDPEADVARRDRMAQAAAPFVHARAEALAPGKKEQAAAVAREAASTGSAFAPPTGPRLAVNNA
jgi:hypothetical protein